MERTLIDEYKSYYKEQMMLYDWNYCTAFHFTSRDRAWSLKQSRDFLYGNILSHIKRRILVYDNQGNLKSGIPFYAYYIICKQLDEPCYHVHIIMKIEEEYEHVVDNFLRLNAGCGLEKLETETDVIRMIKYMLRKGNLVIDSDDVRMIPTGFNLKVKKDHFKLSNSNSEM
jgi:hypothetical protein